ncbi:hypothetical protein, partial [Staphylococcus aureus]|uniref:hypothetical protein n=1 Tax=Staphylococcus aureus TaxID=1280 RepID=UPI00164348FB
RAKEAGNTGIRNAWELNRKEKEGLKAEVRSGGGVCGGNGVEDSGSELNSGMRGLKGGIGDKGERKGSGKYVNADGNKGEGYDEKVRGGENIVSGRGRGRLRRSDVRNGGREVRNGKRELKGNDNLEVAKENGKTGIDGLT